MNSIVGIIDMDGFYVNGKFHCKELGQIKVGNDDAQSSFFDIHLRWDDLSPKDRRTCSYVQAKIHKLPFGVPRGTEALQIENLSAVVKDFYHEIRVNSTSTIAYKGGNIEKDLLANLNIPSVNLECFGCPKAEKLFDQLVWLETCGNHLEANAYHHCAKVEVEAFAMWLEKTLVV